MSPARPTKKNGIVEITFSVLGIPAKIRHKSNSLLSKSINPYNFASDFPCRKKKST
jgi:hypothetical protein